MNSWVRLRKKYKEVTTKDDLLELKKEWSFPNEIWIYLIYFPEDITKNYIYIESNTPLRRDLASNGWTGEFSNCDTPCKECREGTYSICAVPGYRCNLCGDEVDDMTIVNRPWKVDL